MNKTMTFHESYGHLPKGILTLVKRHNVSPADYDQILDSIMPPNVEVGWEWVADIIVKNLKSGIYSPRYF